MAAEGEARIGTMRSASTVWSRSPDVRRKQFLALVRRRVRPGSGSSIDFLRTRTWSEPVVELPNLDAPYVIVGAVATALYMPERVTRDLDILVLAEDAPAVHHQLMAAGYRRAGSLMIGGSVWETPGGLLDVIESDEPWAREALADPARSPTGRPVIRLPYLVLMKLHASRTIDFGDLSRMLGFADDAARREVREVVGRYKPDALEDVESFIELGALELQTGERTDET